MCVCVWVGILVSSLFCDVVVGMYVDVSSLFCDVVVALIVCCVCVGGRGC